MLITFDCGNLKVKSFYFEIKLFMVEYTEQKWTQSGKDHFMIL